MWQVKPMAINVKLIATGDVQKVGYRDKVQKIALEMGIKGYVRNLEDQTVEIVCEGDQKTIEKFKKAIAIKKGFINVKEIKAVKTSKATNKFKIFSIKRGNGNYELAERLDTAIIYLDATKNEIKGAIKEGNAELGNKIDKVGANVNNMADRMDANFDKMEKKYHVIHEEVKASNENLTKLVDSFTKLVNDYVDVKNAQKKQ